MMFENFGNYLIHMGEFELEDRVWLLLESSEQFMLLFWIAIVVAVVWFIKWIIEQDYKDIQGKK